MALQPSRRDVIGPPPRNDVSNLAALVRHQGSWLRSIDPGIQGGRFATPRPVPAGVPSQLVGDDAGGGDEPQWEDGDRLTVSKTGQQVWLLSHEPIEESLFVRWHPRGLTHAGIPWPNEHWTLDGQSVVIPDDTGLLEVGDAFSAQYQYLLEDDEVFDGITLIGHTPYYGAAGHPTSIALPAGTEAGDLIVLGTVGNLDSVSDPRLTQVGWDMWVGFASDLSAVQVTSGADYWAADVATFRVSTSYTSVVGATGTSSPGTLPTVAGQGAIAVVTSGYSLVDGQATVPTNYTGAGGTGTGKCSVRIAYWVDLAASASPASTTTFGSSISGWIITSIGFGGS